MQGKIQGARTREPRGMEEGAGGGEDGRGEEEQQRSQKKLKYHSKEEKKSIPAAIFPSWQDLGKTQ